MRVLTFPRGVARVETNIGRPRWQSPLRWTGGRSRQFGIHQAEPWRGWREARDGRRV